MECSERKLGVFLPLFTLVPEVFREERRQKKERRERKKRGREERERRKKRGETREETEKEKRERSGERKPLAAGDANLTIMLLINITRSTSNQ